MDALLTYLPMAIAAIGAVFGFFFKSRAKQAQDVATIVTDVATKLIDGIERGRNAESSDVVGSVKNVVKGLLDAAPDSVRDQFDKLKSDVVGD